MKSLKILLKDDKNKEIFAQLALFVLILIFLIPLLSGLEGICYDDAAFISFPRLMAVAKAFQNVEIPFWDSNEYCGAKPFYTMMESPIYNIVFYPFYLMADTKNINQSFFVLFILPFTLLTLFSGFGSYYFFRKVLKANHFISILGGVMYALNPTMGMSNLSLIDTCVFAYMPWIILAIAKFLETHQLKWWLLSLLFLVLLNLSYTLNYTYRIYFIIGLITLILFIWYFIKDKKNMVCIICTISVFIIAIGITAFVWAGIIEGLTWVTDSVGNRLKNILKEVTYSLPPGHLITLFIPGFNGTLDNYHTWGDGFLVHSADRILSGGIFTSLIIFVSILVLYFRKTYEIKINSNIKVWLIIGLFINFFALSIMLGRYSPIFFILCKLFPWFFAIPFPFYFHFAQHLGTIITVGATLVILDTNKDKVVKFINYKTASIYIASIILFMIAYCNIPAYYPTLFVLKKLNFFGILLMYKDLQWFLTNPILYFVIFSAFLIFTISFIKKRINVFFYLVFAGILIESFGVGYPLFYRNQIMPRANTLSKWQQFRRTHHSYPTNFEYFSQVKELDNLLDKKSSRFVSDISTNDNLAWVTNTRCFTGYEGKPIFKSMNAITSQFYKNWPYEMWFYSIPKNLLSNMNVEYIVMYDHNLGENKLYDQVNSIGQWSYTTRPKPFMDLIDIDNKQADNYPKYFTRPVFKIHRIDRPMPYLYFQNKLYMASEAKQKDNLFYINLRKGAFISSIYPLPLTDQSLIKKDPALTEDAYEKQQFKEFEILQSQTNKLLKMNMRWHNRLEVNVSVQEPCMFIRSEAYHPDWKIKIDGKPGKIYPVNFLQQGVYLEKGNHTLIYTFFPKSVFYGLIISLFFLLIVASIITIYLLKKNKKIK